MEFAFLGMDTQKQVIRYRIKVDTDKPVAQVDIGTKFVGADGKVVMDTTLAWRNIVKSQRQPIEKGKTYEDDSYLFPNTARVECKVLRVIYKDGSRWSAPK